MSPVGSSTILGRRKPMGSIPTLGHATLEKSTISCQTQGAAWFITDVLHVFKIHVLKVLFARSVDRFQTYQYNCNLQREMLRTTRPAYFSSTARESCPERLPCVRVKQCVRWRCERFLCCKFRVFTSWVV